jgi:beta-lactamase class C
LFAIAASLAASDQGVRTESFADSIVIPVTNKYDVPGMAVAVSVTGGPYIYSYGAASKNTRKPVTTNTLFELGSISKKFTAGSASFAQQEWWG